MWTLLPVQENYYKKQGTILISAFWILTILLLVVLAFAWRISLELKISRFFTSRVRVTSAARAGLYWAMEVKENKDTTPYDSLKDTWINNEEIFGDILKSREKEEAEAEVNIKYVHHLNEKNEPEYYYGLIDEERKINLNLGLTININIPINGQKIGININSLQILERFLRNLNLPQLTPEMISAILDWRDEDRNTLEGNPEPDYYRNGKFRVLEELLLLGEMDKEKFNILKNYLTIYGSGKININTAERKVLLAVFNSILDFLKEYMRRDFTFDTDSFVDQIIVQREGQPFKNMQELLPLLEQIPIDSGIINIFLDALFTISSTAFQTNIEVNMGKVKKSVEAIFDTEKNKVVYWNEN